MSVDFVDSLVDVTFGFTVVDFYLKCFGNHLFTPVKI